MKGVLTKDNYSGEDRNGAPINKWHKMAELELRLQYKGDD